MKHPDVFGAVAAKAPDAYFEYSTLPALSRFHQQVEKYGGLAEFVEAIPTIHPKRGAFWEAIHTAMYCMAYGPNLDAPLGFDPPIDLETGALIPEVWERWLEFDLVRMIEKPAYQDALHQMKVIFLEVGQFDEYQLRVGARLLHRRMDELDIAHDYEEFPDGHSSTSYRFDVSLPLMANAIAK
jgi:enterochelin esterase family protein